MQNVYIMSGCQSHRKRLINTQAHTHTHIHFVCMVALLHFQLKDREQVPTRKF